MSVTIDILEKKNKTIRYVSTHQKKNLIFGKRKTTPSLIYTQVLQI